MKSVMFLTKSSPGDDGADYKETVILEKEEMVELKTGKPACLA